MFLQFEGIENARDLGGLCRADGARIKPGLLFRTGRLEHATDGDIARLAGAGVRTIIDLRDPGERLRAPDRMVPGAENLSLPALPDLSGVMKPMDDGGFSAQRVHDDFIQIYRYLATSDASIEAYKRFFAVLLASGGAPVLWHCTQGKDRTGVAALLLLTALGIDGETIEREYLLTNEYAAEQLAGFERMENPPFPLDVAREVFTVYADNLRLYTRCVQVEYGTVLNYLELALDVGPAEIETLERYYLEW